MANIILTVFQENGRMYANTHLLPADWPGGPVSPSGESRSSRCRPERAGEVVEMRPVSGTSAPNGNCSQLAVGPTEAPRAKVAQRRHTLAWGGQHRASSEVGVAPGQQRKNKSPAGDRAALPPDRRRKSMICESNPGSRPARLRLANLTPGYHLPSLRDSTTTAVYQHQRSNSFRDPRTAGWFLLFFVRSVASTETDLIQPEFASVIQTSASNRSPI